MDTGEPRYGKLLVLDCNYFLKSSLYREVSRGGMVVVTQDLTAVGVGG